MATYIWFVPGFMGSTLSLYNQGAGGVRTGPALASLWGNLPALANINRIDALAWPQSLTSNTTVAADGLAPSSVGGYSDFVNRMVAALPSGWAWVSYPYDWRRSCRDVGRELATALETASRQGNTNYVLSHSQGSLVAWAAWAYLVADVFTAAMARWVTMGGVLYGTGTAPGMFLEKEQSLNQLLLLQQLRAAGLLGPALAAFLNNQDAGVMNLLEIAATWPGLYDLYPDPSNLDDSFDANRALLWDPTKWAAALVPPIASVMATEKTYFHTWLRTTANLPPPAVVSHIAGVGHLTPIRVQPSVTTANPGLVQALGQAALQNPRATRLLQLPSYSQDNTGDGRCTQQQQLFPGYYAQYVGSLHGSMQNDPYVQQLAMQMFQQANPTAPVKGPLQPVVEWIPAPAVPVPPGQTSPSGVPLITGIAAPTGPVSITPPTPQLRPRVGVDP